jgi:thermitase
MKILEVSMRKIGTLFVILAFCLMSVQLPLASSQSPSEAQALEQSPTPSPKARFVPNEVLVQFKSAASESEQLDAKGLIGARELKRLETEPMRAAGLGVLELVSISNLTVAEAIQSLEKHSAVEFAEPNWIYNHQSTSNDPFYTNGSLWNMYGELTTPINQFGSQAGEAWASGFTGSNTVYVGVIDEGIQFDHPDLAANIWTNTLDPIDGIDNDGNGFIDDSHGWDFYNDDNTVYDGGASGNADDHGTHVAGTIGAIGGNGLGVVGVNWNVTLISAKFLGAGGGTTVDAIRALDYFIDLKTRHNLNIVATNNSYGGGGFSQAFLNAITRAANANILFIAAAGNGGIDFAGDDNDLTAHYPSNYDTTAGAGYDSVISVASITSTGAKSSFSNYGATSVDLGAPGAGVYSTLPFNTYGNYSGTSMATPHVTGAAALYASNNPGSSALDTKNAILNTTTATSSLNGKTVTGGRLNIGNLFESTPFVLTASPGTANPGQELTVNWTAPTGRPANDWIGLYKVGDPETSYISWQYTAGTTSGSRTFTAPSQPGQYEFRYFTNNSYIKVATSNTVTVSDEGGAFSLNASPVTANPGQTLSVTWTAPSGRPANDWIGLYRVGDPETSFISWQYTGGAPSGNKTFTAPGQAGQYDFRYFTNNSYNRVATSNTVTVSDAGATFSLNASPSTANPGQTLTVTWTAPSGRPANDWIGLYKVGDPETSFISWQYTAGAPSGSTAFSAPGQAGQYEFRYLTNNSYNKVATSNTVTISNAAGTFSLNASPSTADPGQTLTVTWAAPSGRPASDWIGLYKVGNPETSFISWQYTAGAPSGGATFTAPSQTGQYEFRYFTNNSFIKVATSNVVSVTN